MGVLLLLACVVGILVRLTLFIRQRDASQFAQVDAAAAIEIVLVGLTGGLLLIMPRYLQRTWVGVRGRSGALWIVLLVLGVVSTTWSINPAYSGFRSVEVFTQVLAVFVIVAHAGAFAATERLVLRLGWFALLLMMLSSVTVSGFSLYGLRSNALSAGAAMLAGYSLGTLIEGRERGTRRMWVSLGAALLMVIFGLSLGSWWATLAGIAAALWWGRASRVLALLPLLGLLVLVLWGDAFIESVVLRNRSVAELATLHGRTGLWLHYWEVYRARPLLGYGYAIAAREMGPVYATNTHNAFVSVLLGSGMVGGGIFVWMLGAFGAELRRARKVRREGSVASMAVAVTALVNGMSLAFFGEGWMPVTFILAGFFALHTLHVAAPVASARRPVRPQPKRRRRRTATKGGACTS